jgi:hypothetical protein
MRWSFTGAFICCLFISSRARCPRCSEVIGYIDTSEMRKHKKRILDAGLDGCRNYGLHLDEQILLLGERTLRPISGTLSGEFTLSTWNCRLSPAAFGPSNRRIFSQWTPAAQKSDRYDPRFGTAPLKIPRRLSTKYPVRSQV